MFNLLKNLFSRKEKGEGKLFKFLIYDDYSDIEYDCWYRVAHWHNQYFLMWKSKWSKDWKLFSEEEKVSGVTFENRDINFLKIGDQPDFKIFLEREPDNPKSKTAIKVMGTATLEGVKTTYQLGYVNHEASQKLKDEKDLGARPHSVFLPYEDGIYGLKITILIRSVNYKKRQAKLKAL